MKILVIYASKTGSCREMAEHFAALLPSHEVTEADLALTTPNPEGYDYVLLGGPIRFGKLPHVLREYLKKYADAVAALPHTLFLCCAYGDQFENYAELVFPQKLLASAEECLYFGGELNLSRQKGIDKLFVYLMRNAVKESEENDAALPGLLPEHVRMLADRLRQRN